MKVEKHKTNRLGRMFWQGIFALVLIVMYQGASYAVVATPCTSDLVSRDLVSLSITKNYPSVKIGPPVIDGQDIFSRYTANGTVRFNYVDCLGFPYSSYRSTGDIPNSPVAISAGRHSSCALLNDGSVQCWGYNHNGELGNGTKVDSPTPVFSGGITNATAISAGGQHSCALLSDGRVKCWGFNSTGQIGNGTTGASGSGYVSGISTAVALSAGNVHTCALLADHSVQCWGNNGAGQLGNGTITNASTPVAVSGIDNAVAIAAGASHSCALLSDGTMKCWGDSSHGELGNGESGYQTYAATPVYVSGITSATAIATGFFDSCAVLQAGQIKCWGMGYLGNGVGPGSNLPVTVSGINNATAVTLGQSFGCAKLNDGTVKCWGLNSHGQLGTGTTTQSLIPVSVSNIADALQIDADQDHVCALLSSGPYCWGDNTYGQIGDPAIYQPTAPIDVKTASSGDSVAAAAFHSCAVLDNGMVQCWGDNSFGQLGDGTTNFTYSNGPTSVVGITTAKAVATGYNHSCALLHDGTVRCWGRSLGELGDGLTYHNGVARSSTPVNVSGISTATAVSAGQYFSCALLANGTVQCWGSGNNGALGNGTQLGSLVPIQVNGINNAQAIASGKHHSCAVLLDGTVQCWGLNSYGVLGYVPTQTNYFSAPVTVPAITSATMVAAGVNHSCALLSDGSVRCWGWHGSLGDGRTNTDSATPVVVSGITTATTIAAGGGHTCVLLADGKVRCWGGTYRTGSVGTLNSYAPGPVSLDGVVTAIAAGENHSCVVMSDGKIQCWGYNSQGQLGDGPKFLTPHSVDGLGIVKWSSSDPSVATVTANGVIQPRSEGTATITATVRKGSTVGLKSKTGTSYVTVNVPNDVSTSTTVTIIPASVLTHSLLLNVNGVGYGTVSGGGVYPDGTTASISAAALSDSVFAGWSSDNAVECASNLVVLNADKICSANFISDLNTGYAPAGSNVSVSPGEGMTVTFENVTAPGAIDIVASASGPTLASDFQLGNPPVFYEISTVAEFSGSAEVCLSYFPSQYTDPTSLHLLHFENNEWVDVTTSNDTTNFIMCGRVTSFSPFVIAQAVSPEPETTDTTAPELTVPADISVEATGLYTNIALGVASAIDAVDGTVAVQNNAPISGFPVGVTTVTYTATDSHGNTATKAQHVAVNDTTAPSLTVPVGVTVEASGMRTAVTLGNASAIDLVDGVITVVNDAPAAGFAVGTTAVIYTATDNHGNATSKSQVVTVTDKTPPTLTVPANVTMEATGKFTSVSLGAALAVDAVDGSVAVSSDAPATGFPVGTTTVSYAATDSHGNATSKTQTVIVNDTTAPTLIVPSDITVEATGEVTNISLGTTTAIDVVDGAVVVANDAPASGFAVGATTVKYTATDSHGNTATQSQLITVVYHFGGFVAPVTDGGVFKLGRVIPVKIQLTYANGTPVTTATPKLALYLVSNGVANETPIDISSVSAADSGDTLRYTGSDGIYIFNLDTKSATSATYNLVVSPAAGAPPKTITISLK